MTGTTAILVLRPAWSKDERYAWSDVGTFAALTVACLAASLVNPNGPRLLEFSLTMGLASDYIKQVVFEWASPLGATYARSYGREAALFGLLLASTLIYGFPYGAAKHRTVGWGLGGRMPYEGNPLYCRAGFGRFNLQ